MESKQHWEKVYSEKATDKVSWFQEHASLSLAWILDLGVPREASIIDVGGGASILVDDLLAQGYDKITVLDLSGNALAKAKKRLGNRAQSIEWLETDIVKASLTDKMYDLWHDRAVFHFLTKAKDRHKYVQQVMHSVKSGGIIIMATFAEDGPTQCSGLPVMRYSASELHAEFGEAFEMIKHKKELHITPDRNEQKFIYCAFRKKIP